MSTTSTGGPRGGGPSYPSYAPDGAPTIGSRVDSFTAIRLVAGREIAIRLRTKAFLVMTAIVLVIIVATVLLFHFLSLANLGEVKVGMQAGDASAAASLEATGDALGQEITVTQVTDEADARQRVADGTIDAYVATDASGGLSVIVDKDLGTSLRGALTVLVQNMALDHQIRELGGDPAAVNQAVAQAALDVQSLRPQPTYDPERLILGAAAGILIYLSLLVGGQMVAQGVVEEKSSRVIELLLSTVRPWQLMTGKVLGLGALGLIQMVLYGVVGVGLSLALGTISLSISAAAGTVVWLIIWYLVGFVMYAFVFAGAGALVSRQEDAGGVIMPVTTFVIVGYVIGISILPNDPSNSFAGVMSLIPLFSPTLMPMRLAMGGVPVWEAALSLVLALATIPLFALLAGRIYRNAVIHIGARMPLRKALAR